MFVKSRLVILGLVALNPLMAFAEANVAATQYHPQQSAATTQSSDDTTSADQSNQAKATTTTKVKARGYKDQPKCKEFTWVGPYVGLWGGGGWGNSDLNSNAGAVTSSSYFTSGVDIASVSQNSSGTVSPKTILGGIQVGNNAQSGYFLYGAVADYGSFRLSDSKSASGVIFPSGIGTYNVKSYMSTSWLGTLRGRIGVVFAETGPSPLVFITGGVAVTNLHVYNAYNDATAGKGFGGGTKTQSKIGWVATAGVEYPIALNWTIDGQYEYVNFGSVTANGFITCGGAGCAKRSPISTAANLNASIVRFGINYKLS